MWSSAERFQLARSIAERFQFAVDFAISVGMSASIFHSLIISFAPSRSAPKNTQTTVVTLSSYDGHQILFTASELSKDTMGEGGGGGVVEKNIAGLGVGGG